MQESILDFFRKINKVMEPWNDTVSGILYAIKTPLVRAEFFDSGIMMRLRYQSIAVDRQEISSNIVGKIVQAFARSEKLGFAYPRQALEIKTVKTASLPPAFKMVEIED